MIVLNNRVIDARSDMLEIRAWMAPPEQNGAEPFPIVSSLMENGREP